MINTTLIYFSVRGVNGLIALATVFCLTRLLTPTEYGVYALGIAAISALSSMLFQWIAVTVSRFYALHLANPDVLLRTAYRVFSPVAAVFMAISIVFAIWQPIAALNAWLVIAIAGGAIATGVHFLTLQVANARIEPVRYGMLTISRGLLTLLGAALLVVFGWGGDGAVLSAALSSIAAVLLFGVRRQNKERPPVDKELRQQMIAYGLPLTLTYVASMTLNYADRFIIGWSLDGPAVAAYSAPYDLCQQTVGVALNVFFLVAYPKVTRAWEQGGAVAARLAMQPLARSMLCAAPLAVGLFAGMADDISALFFGRGISQPASRVMPWIAFGIGIAFFKGYFLDIPFQLTRATRTQSAIIVATALLNVVLNLLLLPYFGIVGAALATLIASACGALASWWLGRGLGVYALRGRDLAAAFAVLAAILIVLRYESISTPLPQPWTFIARGALALTAYTLVALALDLGDVRSALRRRLSAAPRAGKGER